MKKDVLIKAIDKQPSLGKTKDTRKVADLRKIAKEKGIKYPEKLKKMS